MTSLHKSSPILLFISFVMVGINTLPQGNTSVSEGIKVFFEDQPLHEVFQSIEKKSGILFKIPYELREENVTATVEAPDWPTAIRKLLEDRFSWAEVHNENGSLQQVLILSRNKNTASPSVTVTPTSPKSVPIDPPLPLPPLPPTELPPPPNL